MLRRVYEPSMYVQGMEEESKAQAPAATTVASKAPTAMAAPPSAGKAKAIAVSGSTSSKTAEPQPQQEGKPQQRQGRGRAAGARAQRTAAPSPVEVEYEEVDDDDGMSLEDRLIESLAAEVVRESRAASAGKFLHRQISQLHTYTTPHPHIYHSAPTSSGQRLGLGMAPVPVPERVARAAASRVGRQGSSPRCWTRPRQPRQWETPRTRSSWRCWSRSRTTLGTHRSCRSRSGTWGGTAPWRGTRSGTAPTSASRSVQCSAATERSVLACCSLCSCSRHACRIVHFLFLNNHINWQEDPRMSDKDRRNMEEKFRREILRCVCRLSLLMA